MAVVYLARDPAIDRPVAIKLLREAVDTPELRERFAREARSAGRLRHPNIVTVFQVGEHAGAPYIVMEYVPGASLAEIIRQRPALPLRWKLRVVEDLCHGLAYAHKAEVVHRDMKPGNVQIDSDGVVKILDFGIARVGQAKGDETALTQLGMMMGTPNYMAPEQINPGVADHRSDVFAVGLVMYELLTYRTAFGGDSYSVLHKILNDEPEPVEKWCPGIDADIVTILDRAMRKRPEERYQDLLEMRDDLRRVRIRLRISMQGAPDDGPVAMAITDPDASRVSDRAGAAVRSINEAREAFEAGEFEKAVEQADLALGLDNANAEAKALRAASVSHWNRDRLRSLLSAAHEAFAAGQLAAASEHIKQAESLSVDGEEAPILTAQVSALARAVTAALERARLLTAKVDEAREHFSRGSLESASQLVDQALALSPGNREALGLRSSVRSAIEKERARQRALEDAIHDAREHAGRGDFAGALARLASHEGEHESVARVLAEIREQQEAAAHRAVEEQRRREYATQVQAAVRTAASEISAGHSDNALERLRSIRFGDAASSSRALEQLKPQVEALIARAEAGLELLATRAALANGNLADASAALERARTRDRSHPDISVLASAVERAIAAAQRLAQATEHLRQGSHEDAERLVDLALALAPDNPAALALQRDVHAATARERSRQEAIALAVRSARQEAEHGDFAEALARLEQAPADPDVASALAEVRALQGRAERLAAAAQRRIDHASAVEATVQQARKHADSGQYGAALQLVKSLLFDDPSLASATLEQLKTEAEAVVAMCEAAEDTAPTVAVSSPSGQPTSSPAVPTRHDPTTPLTASDDVLRLPVVTKATATVARSRVTPTAASQQGTVWIAAVAALVVTVGTGAWVLRSRSTLAPVADSAPVQQPGPTPTPVPVPAPPIGAVGSEPMPSPVPAPAPPPPRTLPSAAPVAPVAVAGGRGLGQEPQTRAQSVAPASGANAGATPAANQGVPVPAQVQPPPALVTEPAAAHELRGSEARYGRHPLLPDTPGCPG